MLTYVIGVKMVGTVIKSLVSQGKRVIIPDFGAFLIKDSNLSNVLTKENVTFSPFLKYNDGFLENELAHKHVLHKEDARLQVAAFVNAVKTSIFIEEMAFEVPGLGFFYKDKQGNATFSVNRPFDIEATRKAENNTDIADGDKSAINVDVLVENSTQDAKCFISDSTIPQEKEIEAEKVIGEELIVDEAEKELVEIEVKSEKKSDNLPTKEIQLEVKQEKEPKPPINNCSNNTPAKSKPKKLLVSFIMIVVALFVLNLFWTDLFGTKSDVSKPKIVLDPIDTEQHEVETEKVEAKEVAQDAIDNEVVATVEKTVKKASSNSTSVESATETRKDLYKEKEKNTDSKKASISDSKKPSKESSANETKSYVVVLGSFETNENAEKHVANLAKKKVKGHVVHRSKVYSVVTSTFKTYEEAQKERDRVKSLGVDGWISSK